MERRRRSGGEQKIRRSWGWKAGGFPLLAGGGVSGFSAWVVPGHISHVDLSLTTSLPSHPRSDAPEPQEDPFAFCALSGAAQIFGLGGLGFRGRRRARSAKLCSSLTFDRTGFFIELSTFLKEPTKVCKVRSFTPFFGLRMPHKELTPMPCLLRIKSHES